MIRILLDIELQQPYSNSLDTLTAFCSVWDSVILFGGTYKEKAIISMPLRHFKKIFKTNPSIKNYPIPSGMGTFIGAIRVKEIEVE